MIFSKKSKIKNVLLAIVTLVLTISFAACQMNSKEPKPLPRVAENENVKIEGLSDGYLITIKAIRHSGGEIEIDGCPIVMEVFDNQSTYHCPFGQKDKNTKFIIRCDFDTDGNDQWEFKEEELSCAADGGYLWTDLVDLSKFNKDKITVNGSYTDGIFKGSLTSIKASDFIKNTSLVTDVMVNMDVIMGAVDWQEPNHFNPETDGLFRTDNYSNWCFSLTSNDDFETENRTKAFSAQGIELNRRWENFEFDPPEINFETPDDFEWYDHGLQYAMRAELRFKIKGYDTNDWPVFKTYGIWSEQYKYKGLQPEHLTVATDSDGIKITLNNYFGDYPEANIRVNDCPVTLRFHPEDRDYYSDPATKSKKFIFTEKDKEYLVVADIRVADGTDRDWVREAVFCTAGGGKKFEDCINLDVGKYYESMVNVNPPTVKNGKTSFKANLDTGMDFTEDMIKDSSMILDFEIGYDVVLGNRNWEWEENVRSDVFDSWRERFSHLVELVDEEETDINSYIRKSKTIINHDTQRIPDNFNWDEFGNRYTARLMMRFFTKGQSLGGDGDDGNPHQYELEDVWSQQYYK